MDFSIVLIHFSMVHIYNLPHRVFPETRNPAVLRPGSTVPVPPKRKGTCSAKALMGAKRMELWMSGSNEGRSLG